MVGYSGAKSTSSKDPTHQNVQDYAETIQINFDTDVLSYDSLLDMFFAFHTPAPPQFTGTQYRSAIFYHTPEQKLAAEAALDARGAVARFVAVEPASNFYRGEEYHQKYLKKAMSF